MFKPRLWVKVGRSAGSTEGTAELPLSKPLILKQDPAMRQQLIQEQILPSPVHSRDSLLHFFHCFVHISVTKHNRKTSNLLKNHTPPFQSVSARCVPVKWISSEHCSKHQRSSSISFFLSGRQIKEACILIKCCQVSSLMGFPHHCILMSSGCSKPLTVRQRSQRQC